MPASRDRRTSRTVLLAAFAALLSACGGDAGANGRPAAARSDTLSDSALMVRADAGRYEGSETAPIWIVMVSDFQCPYCKVWHDSTLAAVRRNYVVPGRARLAYLNLPLQMHRHAHPMAEAALCAGAQGQFWKYADSLFAKQDAITKMTDVEPTLRTIAATLQLDSAAFAHCRGSQAINALIQSDLRQADQAHIRSTPSFFVGQFLLEGAIPYSSFKGAIDSALVVAGKKR